MFKLSNLSWDKMFNLFFYHTIIYLLSEMLERNFQVLKVKIKDNEMSGINKTKINFYYLR